MPKDLRILSEPSLLPGMIRRSFWCAALLAIGSVGFLVRPELALGLEIVTEQDPARSSVLLQWEVQTGSALDPESRKGLAHYTARALWWGTQSRPLADIERTLNELGASYSVTPEWRKVTLSAEVPAEFFESFLHLLRDVLTQPRFDPGEMDVLRRVLRREIRDDGGQTPGLGTEEGVRRVRPNELKDYFKSHYQSKNMRVLVIAPWVEGSVRESIERNFDSLDRGSSRGWAR